jgi:hypothetical protein
LVILNGTPEINYEVQIPLPAIISRVLPIIIKIDFADEYMIYVNWYKQLKIE